jgi:hypothetical protein
VNKSTGHPLIWVLFYPADCEWYFIYGLPPIFRYSKEHIREVSLHADFAFHRAVGACANLAGIQSLFRCRNHSRCLNMDFRLSTGVLSWLAVSGILALFTLALTLDRGDCRTVRKISGRCKRLFLSVNLPAVYQLSVCTNRFDAVGSSRLCRKSTGNLDSGIHSCVVVKSASG